MFDTTTKGKYLALPVVQIKLPVSGKTQHESPRNTENSTLTCNTDTNN